MTSATTNTTRTTNGYIFQTAPTSRLSVDHDHKGIMDDWDTDEVSKSNVMPSGHVHGHGPGTAPESVYDASMAWWRAGIRRRLVKNLKTESKWIAGMQNKVRTPWLDTYFVYTSSLGTHTFFMTVLPAFFFFGYHETGRGLLFVLATGVYLSSLVKDSICSPRPFAPPVTRLTMGSHHLEYGFPSTHSTNSVSIALYFFNLLHHLEYSPGSATNVFLNPVVYYASSVLLAWYAFSIVYGRLYCAMHSFTDCAMGIILGTAIWAVQNSCGALLEAWLQSTGWGVPLLVVPIGLFLVNQHAEPVDDCPCFEDAIAFVSVIIGACLARWHAANWGFDEHAGFYTSMTPGWEGRDLGDWAVWLAFGGLKMIVGVLLIFTWRLLAKSTLHMVLPPLFRTLARLFTLPNRRFYTPATDYDGSVPEDKGLHPIPSVIDIPGMLTSNDGGASTALPRYSLGHEATKGNSGMIQMRNGKVVGEKKEKNIGWQLPVDANGEVERDEEEEVKKHYDADVLTKVIVYMGIGWIATEFIPVLFELLGWGVVPTGGRIFIQLMS